MASSRCRSAVSCSIDIFALVEKLVLVYGPHVEVAERDVSQRNNIGSTDDDRCAGDTVIYRAGPIIECEAAEGNSSSVWCGMRFPVLINIW